MLYDIDGDRHAPEGPGFKAALARAHALHRRPRCLCRPGGIEMYVARMGDSYVMKRMPFTGSWHATSCLSYDLVGSRTARAAMGLAIHEDAETGVTLLRLGFRMSRGAGHQRGNSSANDGVNLTSKSERLSLLGLLHYLWDEAELTHWRPQFRGRRSWGAVRRLLLAAAENKVFGGERLVDRLYVPEPFIAVERDAIADRRRLRWATSVKRTSSPQQLLLCVAELKRLLPSPRGFLAILKHVPDQGFVLEEQVYRGVVRHFQAELSLWRATSDVHMIMTATFGLGSSETPEVIELALMPATAQWLPISDLREHDQIEQLVRADRTFRRGLTFEHSGRYGPFEVSN